MQLAHIRKNKKITQIELSKKLFVDQTTISKYECGKISPTIEQLPKLAQILDCSIEELVFALIETKKQAQQESFNH